LATKPLSVTDVQFHECIVVELILLVCISVWRTYGFYRWRLHVS